MTRFTKILAISALALLIFVPVASAQRGRVFIRGGFGFGGFYGPGYGWWGPAYPYPYYPYYGSYMPMYNGKVKIESHTKDALVYVDGGYIGTVEKSKHFSLRPGEHDIQLRDPGGHPFYSEHIRVLPGRTTEIKPDTAVHK